MNKEKFNGGFSLFTLKNDLWIYSQFPPKELYPLLVIRRTATSPVAS